MSNVQNAEVDASTRQTAENIDVFTFYVGETLYATRMENVLSLGQSNQTVRSMPGYPDEALGVVDYQGFATPLFDLAMLLDIKATYTLWEEVCETITVQKQKHLDWMGALENSIKTASTFTEARDAGQCEFGQWCVSFETKDEELKELLSKLTKPHEQFHALVDKLIGLTQEDCQKEALGILDAEREQTLATLSGLFDRTHHHLGSLARTVLLYTTIDGKTPVFALKMSEVSDAQSYTQAQLSSNMIEEDSEAANLVEGFLSNEDGEICVLLDVNKIQQTVSDLPG